MTIYMIAYQYDWDMDTELLPTAGYFRDVESAQTKAVALKAKDEVEEAAEAAEDYARFAANHEAEMARWTVLKENGLALYDAPPTFGISKKQYIRQYGKSTSIYTVVPINEG